LEIFLVEPLGYCPGVKRALKLAEINLKKSDGHALLALGELIHNGPEIRRLERQGLRTVASVGDIPDDTEDTVLVRAHGVRPEVIERLKDKPALRIVDGTCNVVVRAVDAAVTLWRQGKTVVIYGSPTHPEIIGMMGHVKDQAFVVQSADEVDALPDNLSNIGVVTQTTKAPDHFDAVCRRLKQRYGEDQVEIRDTLCSHVERRIADTMDMATMMDLMIVVGGKKSSNTRSLTVLCQEAGVPVHQIESHLELQPEWFQGKQRVGVTAGVSTPPCDIQDVYRRIHEVCGLPLPEPSPVHNSS
jgi:4-hydroxy-3-methylbut-2-enyl diphosphate reductase